MHCGHQYTLYTLVNNGLLKSECERISSFECATLSTKCFLWCPPYRVLCAICSCLVINMWPLAKATGHKVSLKTFPTIPSLLAEGTKASGADKMMCVCRPPPTINSVSSLLLCHWANLNASCLCVYSFNFFFVFLCAVSLCALCLALSHISFQAKRIKSHLVLSLPLRNTV